MAECIQEEVPTELTFKLTRNEVEVIRQLVGKTSPVDARELGCSTEMLKDGESCTLDNIYSCFGDACHKHWGTTIRPMG